MFSDTLTGNGEPMPPRRELQKMWVNTENTIWGKVVASPSPGRGESSEFVLPMACPNTKVDPK